MNTDSFPLGSGFESQSTQLPASNDAASRAASVTSGVTKAAGLAPTLLQIEQAIIGRTVTSAARRVQALVADLVAQRDELHAALKDLLEGVELCTPDAPDPVPGSEE